MEAVRRQRETLCDLLESLSDQQWDAETMCEGWDAGDVVAHMLVRERDLWAAPGIVLPPLAALAEKRMASRKRKGRAALIAALRKGPPRLMAFGPLGRVQVGEDYIHAEDIRRGAAADLTGAELTPDDGTGDAEVDEILWGGIGRFAPLTLKGLRAEGVVAMTDGGRTRAYRVGDGMARAAGDGKADVTLSGSAGELLLFVTGRKAHQVAIHGDQALVDALTKKGRRV